jgi:hypothetical protein
MKHSKTPTDHIVIRATTNSEWDTCDFVLVSITDGFLQRLQQRQSLVETLPKDSSFYSMSYWECVDKWCVHTGDDYEFESMLQESKEGWCFVELEEGEEEELFLVEQRVDTQTIDIDKTFFKFKGYGKHTSEEFWTEDVNTKEFLNRVNVLKEVYG